LAHRTAVHWHVAPQWECRLGNGRATLTTADQRVELVAPVGVVELFRADESSGLGWHAPVYGRVEAATTIRISHGGRAPLSTFSVFGLNPANEIAGVETVPVWAEAGVLVQAIALRISRAGSIDYFMLACPTGGGPGKAWRVGEIETDAHMLFCRTLADGHVTRVALVDGSLVRASGHRRLLVALPREVPDVHLDFSGVDQTARLSGPASGARIQVAGRECAVDVERRALARDDAC
jgi:hypothetical protein